MFRSGLVSNLKCLATHALAALGQLEDAERSLRRAVGVAEGLAADFPGVPGYRGGVATCFLELGRLQGRRGRLEDAERSLRRAVGVAEGLAADFPGVPGYRRYVVLCFV